MWCTSLCTFLCHSPLLAARKCSHYWWDYCYNMDSHVKNEVWRFWLGTCSPSSNQTQMLPWLQRICMYVGKYTALIKACIYAYSCTTYLQGPVNVLLPSGHMWTPCGATIQKVWPPAWWSCPLEHLYTRPMRKTGPLQPCIIQGTAVELLPSCHLTGVRPTAEVEVHLGQQ